LSKGKKDGMKAAAELISKGATMLSEPCPQCGGVQLRYHGKIYCANHDDLSAAITSVAVSADVVMAEMREILLSKLNEAAVALGVEKDGVRQDQLVSLMTKYFDLLERLPK
jgi:UPF0148 protein